MSDAEIGCWLIAAVMLAYWVFNRIGKLRCEARARGFRYAAAQLASGRSVEALENDVYFSFDFDDFDRGIIDCCVAHRRAA